MSSGKVSLKFINFFYKKTFLQNYQLKNMNLSGY